MIITERKLDITDRDEAPKAGDSFLRRNGEEASFLRVVAHFPGFVVNRRAGSPSTGVWEVAIVGQRKPSILMSVYWGGSRVNERGDKENLWYEVPSR